MALLHKKTIKSSCSLPCALMRWMMCALFLAIVIVAVTGAYQTHVLATGPTMTFQFGSTSGSLALIALIISLMAFLKQLTSCLKTCEVCK